MKIRLTNVHTLFLKGTFRQDKHESEIDKIDILRVWGIFFKIKSSK